MGLFDIVILGQKLRLEVIIICLVVGAILGGHLFCSCSKVTMHEGLEMIKTGVEDIHEEIKKDAAVHDEVEKEDKIHKEIKKTEEVIKKAKKEGFATLSGSPLVYQMGQGVPTSWETNQALHDAGSADNWYKSLEGNTAPLPLDMINSGKLDILGSNVFDSKCCPSSYSSSMGCACVSPEQMKYLSQRGGNRTFNTEF